MIGIGQHLGHFELARFGKPTMEDFEKKVALKIDKDRLGVFVAAFGAAAPECLLRRTDVNETREIFLRAQALNRQNEIARNTGEIAFSDLIQRYRPGPALDDYFSATQSRHVRRHPELKWVKTKWNDPVASKGTEIFVRAPFAQGDVAARWIDIDFGFRRRDNTPAWI